MALTSVRVDATILRDQDMVAIRGHLYKILDQRPWGVYDLADVENAERVTLRAVSRPKERVMEWYLDPSFAP